MDVFVTCAQGLEPLLSHELHGLGYDQVNHGYRGVYVKGADLDAIYRINYSSRLAGRVLLPLSRFRCNGPQDLYKGASGIDWEMYFTKEKTFAIDANVSHRQLRNSLYAAQVVKDAICDQFQKRSKPRPNVDVKEPDLQLNLFIYDDYAVLSFDTSGIPLHKRGYRQESTEAPLQESLAAALLVLADYKGDEILCDPCCGSGTFLIEAALMASKTAPGYLRKHWGFMNLPNFSHEKWLKIKTSEDERRIPLNKGHFCGCDINKNAVRICRTNIRAAGFHDFIKVENNDVKEYIPEPPPNFVITNPPHGRRLGAGEELYPLYRSIGDFMKRMTSKPARGFVFTGNLPLAKEIGLAASRRHVVDNSGVDSRLLEFDLY